METLKILEKQENLNWDYDEEADVLYISIGKPKEALGIDIGDGNIVRYSEKSGEIIGLTILGVKEKVLSALTEEQ
jgi:uncharacterized protein YuzE